jgi:hypothetical protein
MSLLQQFAVYFIDTASLEKIQQVALQRSSQYRGDFMAKIQFFNVEQLVWLDETGCDR